MTDSTLNRFLASGTNAERLAFTPDPPTPGSGPDPTYFWKETDTGNSYAWNFDGASWQQINGGLADADYGDIVVSSGVWSIDSNAVTYAKMQDVSATSRILGRKTAAAGDPEECTLSEILDFIGSAAQGDILYRNATAWARLGAGTSGQVLTTGGAGSNPSWADASGGGWTEAKFWNQAVDGSAASIECDVTGATEVLILGNDLANSTSVQRVVNVSVDGGTSWFTTSGNYDDVAATGVATGNAAFFPHNTSATAARTFSVHIRNNGMSRKVHAHLEPRQAQARFLGSTTAINRVRVTGTSDGVTFGTGSMNGGTIQFLVR